MIGFAKLDVVILINYWILVFGQFHFISGTKPKCEGGGLEPKEFSAEEDVGFVRDICVDMIARNLYNKFGYPVSTLCEELANIRTSTCFCKCSKWKRSSCWNTVVTTQVMVMAIRLMENFTEVFSKEESLTDDDKEFIFDLINDAKHRLIKSKATSENTKLIDHLEDIKNYCCTRYQLDLYQTEYLNTIGKIDAEITRELDDIVKNDNLLLAIKQFIINFQAESGVKILNYYIDENRVRRNNKKLGHILRLKFKQRERDSFHNKVTSAILKIPSLRPMSVDIKTVKTHNREVLFYDKLLPALFQQFGPIEPFAPRPYAVTQNGVLVLEDLTGDKFFQIGSSVLFDFEHTVTALYELGTYHALTFMYLQHSSKDDPSMSLIRSFEPIPISKDDLDRFCDWLKPLNQPLYQKIFNIREIILSDSTVRKLPRENSMTVIIHGDLRSQNIFFKYTNLNGDVQKAKIIDWESASKASIALDLINFFLNNVPVAIFENTEDYFLKFYLTRLKNELSPKYTNREYSRPELDGDMAYYKYYYLRVLLNIFKERKFALISDSSSKERNPFELNVIEWLGYLDRRGII